MAFTSPLVLLLLLPWLGTALWLMSRRRGATLDVPFVHLWPSASPPSGAEWRPRRLPWPVVVMLAGVAAAIFAGAGAVWGGRDVRSVTLVIDRGISMSAIDVRGASRMAESVQALEVLQEQFGLRFDSVMVVPGGELPVASAAQLPSTLYELRPAASDTRSGLLAAIAEAGRRRGRPVVVLSDHPGLAASTNAVQVRPPATPLPNAGIAMLSAVAGPSPQAMVRLAVWPVEGQRTVRVVVRSAGAERSVEVVVSGGRGEGFVDIPEVGDVIEARLELEGHPDAVAADNVAWATRRVGWPRPVISGLGLPPEVGRFIEAYADHRPRGDSSPLLTVAVADATAVPEGPGVFLAMTGEAVSIQDHPSVEVSGKIGSSIDWPRVLRGAAIGPEPAREWTPLVRVGGRTVVARGAGGTDRVLINFWSSEFASQADFVVLLTDIFDSFAVGGGEWVAENMGASVPRGWEPVTAAVAKYEPSPGVYNDATGRPHALNAASVNAPSGWGATGDSPEVSLARLAVHRAGGIELRRPLLLAATILAAAGAAWRWAGRPDA